MRFYLLLSLVLFTLCSTQNPTQNTAPKPDPDPIVTWGYLDSVPSGANIINQRVAHASIPAGWTTVAPWMISVHNPDLGSTSKVEVAFLELYSVPVVSGTGTLIASTNYPTRGFDQSTDGGLYSKYPTWFKVDTHVPMPATVEAGNLVFYPHTVSDSIWHWWTDRALLPATSNHIVLIAKVRISGGACVQMGVDWWKTMDAQWCGLDQCNTEVMCSRWYFASPGWQTLMMSSR